MRNANSGPGYETTKARGFGALGLSQRCWPSHLPERMLCTAKFTLGVLHDLSGDEFSIADEIQSRPVLLGIVRYEDAAVDGQGAALQTPSITTVSEGIGKVAMVLPLSVWRLMFHGQKNITLNTASRLEQLVQRDR
jgi:hypothetical protein